jgi:DNA-binding response OmpR family regulator
MANPIIDEATRVIVADDDEDERSLVVAALRDDGYDVREACDGAELLMMMDDPALRPDVVVTDVKMPRLSGLGVLHKLRGALSVPVVVMTGLTDGSIRTMAMQLGAVAVLSKPFDPDDMLTAVCNAKLLHANHNHHR